ncbi:ATP-dependent acyl-CoA ligase [Sporichthya brevicatena]|uniref:ATP-dependent acyl-CoA ligase n=1 Tax=Sporichthya brevicatena TaxID=171442 RepID=A0ABN1HAY0_9ACTN
MHQITFSRPRDRMINALLPAQAEHNGDATWLMFGDRSYTFAQGEAEVIAQATGLAALGLRQGDIVALMMDNSDAYVFTALALAHLGAVQVSINTAYRGEFLRRMLEDCAPVMLIADDRYGETISAVLRDVPGVKQVVVHGDVDAFDTAVDVRSAAEVAALGGPRPPAAGRHTDLLSISFTSGTTGRSKGVMQSNAYWCNAAIAMAAGRDIRADDVFHLCTPMFHSGAWLLNLYPSLIYGLPVGMESRFSVGDYWSSVRRYGATQLFTLSAMHMWIVAQPELPDDADNPGRVWTAVPLPPGLADRMKQRFGIQAMFSAYGSTEAMPMTIGNVNRPAKDGSSGWAQVNLEVAIVDDDDVVQPPDTVGEIVVRPTAPDAVFSGYYHQPEATLATMRNYWLHTGDLGRLDADGELFFVDRKADYMRRRGENISSMEVEQVVCRHPAVAMAAVHPVPAEDSEDEVKLCVVLAEGAEIDHLELAKYCDQNLPYFVVPRYIEFLDELPRTPTERVQKHLLRERGVTPTTWDAQAAGFTVTR